MNLKHDGLTLVLMTGGAASDPNGGYHLFIETYWERLKAVCPQITVISCDHAIGVTLGPEQTATMDADELINQCAKKGGGGTDFDKVLNTLRDDWDLLHSENVIIVSAMNLYTDMKEGGLPWLWMRERNFMLVAYTDALEPSSLIQKLPIYKGHTFSNAQFEFYMLFQETHGGEFEG